MQLTTLLVLFHAGSADQPTVTVIPFSLKWTQQSRGSKLEQNNNLSIEPYSAHQWDHRQ
jgi:hypothetical protein